MNAPIQTIETAGLSMDYFCFGRGDKPLVILPGLSVDSIMKYADRIEQAYDSFTGDYTVYVFDKRKNPPGIYPVRDMAQDTAAAVRALGLEHVFLFGASLGGMLALTIASEQSDLVRGMILGSTTAVIEPERYQQVFDPWIQLAKTGNAEELYLAFSGAIYPQTVFETARKTIRALAAEVTGEDIRRFIILAEGLKGFNVLDRLQAITCPVLILGVKDDNVLGPEASVRIYEGLKGQTHCELYLYDGYGHAAYDLAPDYKERMLQFLSCHGNHSAST